MTTEPKSLLWIFDQDGGFYFADGARADRYRVTPMTTVVAGEPVTQFIVDRLAECVEERIGILYSMENAKTVCELLENG